MAISMVTDMSLISGVNASANVNSKQQDSGDGNFQSLMDTVAKVSEETVNLVGGSQANTKPTEGVAPSNAYGETKQTDTLENDDKASVSKTDNSGKTENSKTNTEKNDSLSNHKDVKDEKTEVVTSELKDKILNEAATKLGISVEDLENVLAQLGITAADLLNTDNVSLLVAQVVGDGDMMSLITDENAMNIVNELNSVIEGLSVDAATMLNVEQEALTDIMKDFESLVTGVTDEADISGVITNKASNEVVAVELGSKGQEISEKAADTDGEALVSGEAVNVTAGEEIKGTSEKESNQSENGSSRNEKNDNPLVNGEAIYAQTNSQDATVFEASAQPEEVFTGNAQMAREIVSQVQDQIRAQFSEGLTELQMQLNPENLGTVHLTVASREGNVTAQLHVQNEAVQQALESQVIQIKESLESQGVKVSAIEVLVSSHGFEQNLEQGNDSNEQQEEVNEELKKATRKLNLQGGLTDEIIEELSEEELVTAKMMEADGNQMDYRV